MRSQLVLAFALVSVIFVMGAKLTKQPIGDFNGIAGMWKGRGNGAPRLFR